MNTSLREYINKVRWQLAKDKTHDYTVVTWKPELENEFREFVKAIYAQGFKDKFYGRTYTYLTIDDYTYWTMGYSVQYTILINRKKAQGTATK